MKNKTKGESPEEMITPKDIRKVKEAVRDNTCAQAGERKTQRILGQNYSVVVRAFHTFPLQLNR